MKYIYFFLISALLSSATQAMDTTNKKSSIYRFFCGSKQQPSQPIKSKQSNPNKQIHLSKNGIKGVVGSSGTSKNRSLQDLYQTTYVS